VLLEYQPRRTIQIDLRIVPEPSFGAAWQYFTGSKAHNVRLRELAVKRGWSLNEYGLTEGKRVVAAATEEDIYAALGVPCFPPELREDRGEFDLREVPRELLRLKDIRGDLHVHTTESDGVNTAEEMIAAARARGYAYVCISDHSPSSTIANGLSAERLLEQIDRIRALARKARGITAWVGSEVDIRTDGSLDYEDELLTKLDFVVASVHAGMGRDQEANTRRTLAAIENPYVNAIGHPTGRLIGKRDAMPLDIEAVCRAAARTGTALEINASHLRLDLKDQHARLARELGARICINTDAHSIDEYEEIRFGVVTARRAGLRRGDVLNTWPAAEIAKFVQAKRNFK
jgi:DNA polymerase (family 10)